MIRVGILYGGRSGEHNVSKCSAASVVKFLDKTRYDVIAIGVDHDGRWYVQDSPEVVNDKDFGEVLKLNRTGDWYLNHYERDGKLWLTETGTGRVLKVDVVFPVMHGTFCEDGTLQGLLELAMVPYVGADVLGSAVGMDKDVAKRLLRDAEIPVVEWLTIRRSEWGNDQGRLIKQIENEIRFPCFVKPSNAGSSVGISKVKNIEALGPAINEAFQWDDKILVEKGHAVREIEFSVIGNDNVKSSVPGEIRPRHDFYSYEAKYIDSEGAELIIPAELSEELIFQMKKTAEKGYRVLCCKGMARVDFFLDLESGNYYLNEINTLPGFTNISMYPKLWGESGLGYTELLEKLIDLAIERSESKKCIKTEF